MKKSHSGKIEKAQLLIFPPALVICLILAINGYKWLFPPSLTINSTEVVNVVQVIDGLSPLRKTGVPYHQTEPLGDGGSSRLLITQKSDQGTHVLVQGRISHSFLGSKIPLDKMINLRINTNDFRVEADGEQVPCILLTPRTKPVLVGFSAIPEVPPPAELTGMALPDDPNHWVNNTGIQTNLQLSTSAAGGLPGRMGSIRFEAVFPNDATALIEMPRTIHLPSPAMGGKDLDVAFLLPLESAASGRHAIHLFGERVARLKRNLFSDRGRAE